MMSFELDSKTIPVKVMSRESIIILYYQYKCKDQISVVSLVPRLYSMV